MLTIATAYVSALCYAVAIGLLLRSYRRGSRVWWTVGLGFYLCHVVAAFTQFYAWSHGVAVRETARQTAALFGVESGAGIYFNYVFTVVWLVDCGWWWLNETTYRARRWALSAAIHGYMAFMFFNGVVVFGHGVARWIGLALSFLLLVLFMVRRDGLA